MRGVIRGRPDFRAQHLRRLSPGWQHTPRQLKCRPHPGYPESPAAPEARGVGYMRAY